MHSAKCFANYMGIWVIEPLWFQQAFELVRTGVWEANRDAEQGPGAYTWEVVAAEGEGEPSIDARAPAAQTGREYAMPAEGIARIPIEGPLMKADPKYSGTSTVRTRHNIRAAVQDPEVRGILLHIDSPGGHVAGTDELAQEIKAASSKKLVHAHIDDQGASAAYWAASQAGRITANRTADIGSIGTMAIIEDASGAAEMQGVKVHVVSSGKFKGAFAPGTTVTEEQLGLLQDRVDNINGHFLRAVSRGRSMSMDNVREVADGRVFSAQESLTLGLIDEVATYEGAVTGLSRQLFEDSKATAAHRAGIDIRIAENSAM